MFTVILPFGRKIHNVERIEQSDTGEFRLVMMFGAPQVLFQISNLSIEREEFVTENPEDSNEV